MSAEEWVNNERKEKVKTTINFKKGDGLKSDKCASSFLELDTAQNLDNNYKKWADCQKDRQAKFHTYKIYINLETNYLEVQTSYGGDALSKAVFPENFFRTHPYVTLRSDLGQVINVRSLFFGTANEYRMTNVVPWLPKRDDWRLSPGVT